MTEPDMTEAQAQDMLREMAQGKQNMHSFLSKVVNQLSTVRLGNLSQKNLECQNYHRELT